MRGSAIILSFFLFRQVLFAWPYIQRIKSKVQRNFRGSSKDPLINFLVISLFLFGFLVILPPYFFPKGDFFSFAFQKISNQAENNFFIKNQDKKGYLAISPSPIIQKNSILALSPPEIISPKVLGSLGDFKEENKEISEYIVQPRDTLSSIAEKSNISLQTLLWANELSENSKIQPGKSLIILPVSGVLHHVRKGETLTEITQIYQGDVAEIIAFNEISGEKIFVGDILIIPNGKLTPPKPQYTKKPSPSVPQIPLANSYFILPTQGRISQGLHWYNAIDIQNSCGSPVFAAAGGQVSRIKYGNSGYGNHIQTMHPNDVATLYAHLAAILVSPGQSVSPGEIIGLVGGKPGMPGAGRSTGCHLHFEVRGTRNPFAP